jgi:cell division transport system permease protein
LAIAVVVLIGLAAVATVIFTTRMGISIHHDVIELLHLIGARDGYVAAQFQRQAMLLGLRGGVLGIVFAVATLYGLRHVAGRLETPLAPDIPVAHWAWGLLAAVPVATALIAMVTARLTALRELAKMP